MSDGTLILNDTGEAIGPVTTAADFAQSKAASRGMTSYGTEQTEVEFKPCLVSGTRFAAASLIFRGPRLSHIDMMLPIDGDERGWDNWTMQNEMSRKAAHESWAERAFAVQLLHKPIEGIVPYEPGPDYPRHAITPWGEVISYYDSKGGFAFLRVRYGTESP